MISSVRSLAMSFAVISTFVVISSFAMIARLTSSSVVVPFTSSVLTRPVNEF